MQGVVSGGRDSGCHSPCLPAKGDCMTDSEYSCKLDELDRLLNDPTVPMQPDRIWSLLADVSGHAASTSGGEDGD
jgi:hypothetical protein